MNVRDAAHRTLDEPGKREPAKLQLSKVEISAVDSAIFIAPALAKIGAWCMCGLIAAGAAVTALLR